MNSVLYDGCIYGVCMHWYIETYLYIHTYYIEIHRSVHADNLRYWHTYVRVCVTVCMYVYDEMYMYVWDSTCIYVHIRSIILDVSWHIGYSRFWSFVVLRHDTGAKSDSRHVWGEWKMPTGVQSKHAESPRYEYHFSGRFCRYRGSRKMGNQVDGSHSIEYAYSIYSDTYAIAYSI